MFTGIIEQLGRVVAVEDHGTNRDLTISAAMTPELRVDQSVAHNGVCLTVVALEGDRYTVTAVQETLARTNLGWIKAGWQTNIEIDPQTQAIVDTVERVLAARQSA